MQHLCIIIHNKFYRLKHPIIKQYNMYKFFIQDLIQNFSMPSQTTVRMNSRNYSDCFLMKGPEIHLRTWYMQKILNRVLRLIIHR